MSAGTRRGTLLVVVVGLCSLIATMGLAFLVRMRGDGEDSARFAQEIQARVMLASALMYVQEGARIGWKGETFGWRDIRDGMPGPRGFDGDWTPPLHGALRDDGTATSAPGRFPAIRGRAARSPMYPMRLPPYAIRMTIAPNPVPVSDAGDTAALSLPWSELVNYTVPDPQPVAASWAEFKAGDPRPIAAGGAAWFRVYRSDVTTFVLSCGAGASQGYRDWQEVQDEGATASFAGPGEFEAIRRDETILWYEAQWSARVSGNNFLHGYYGRFDQRQFGDVSDQARDTPNLRQFGGTFTYIERLPAQPAAW